MRMTDQVLLSRRKVTLGCHERQEEGLYIEHHTK